MENKYYTPKLEEFYIGFEFETLDDNKGWQKSRLVSGRQLDQGIEIGTYNDTVNVRVKYLDKQDVEELGTEFNKEGFSKHLNVKYLGFNSEKHNIMVAHYLDINKISIATLDPSKNPIMLKTNWDDKQVNFIACKNKSELKKIMKMINIL